MKCLLFNVTYDSEVSRTLGVYRIAHILRNHNWDAEVIDFATVWTIEQLKELVKSRDPKNLKFIGFGSLFTLWSETMEEFCRWVKSTYPGIVLIFGSQGTPLFESKFIDYYIKGFGEKGLLSLLEYLFSNGNPIKYSLTSNVKKKVIPANVFYSTGFETDLMVKYEDRDFIQPGEWLAIEFARGCRFKCSFCDFPFLGSTGDHSRSEQNFLEQVRDAYDRFGVTNYTVADSTFNDYTEKITRYADAVEKLNFVPWFQGFIRADLLITRPRDREELLRMNFLGHSYGIETFNRASGKTIGKGIDPDKLKDGILEAKKYFLSNGRKLYRAHMSFITGLPYETKESLSQTSKWLYDHWQDQTASARELIIFDDDPDNKSMITLDYKQYGYTILERLHDKPTYGLPWRNDHMDIYEASELADKLNWDGNRYLDMWSLPSLRLLGKPIEERLKVTVKDHDSDGSVVDQFWKNYIYKKLSM